MARRNIYLRKPLSFSTTMRNPERIADFLASIEPFEGKTLTNGLIGEIIRDWIMKKLYRPDNALRENPEIKALFCSEDGVITPEQAMKLYLDNESLSSGHKEAGFDKGWPSRFDTYMKLPKELGFIYYGMQKPIRISETGKALINAVSHEESGGEVSFIPSSDVFLNALVKYQTDNPFRRNLIANAPFVLYLRTVLFLQELDAEAKSGIFRHEIPFVICWPDADARGLAEYIYSFRQAHGKQPSNEVVYSKCLQLLETENTVRFKMKQITHEGPDDFIRKLRMTGLVSLRGGGRLIDINRFEIDRINFVVDKYSSSPSFNDEIEYFEYAGRLDHDLVDTHTQVSDVEADGVRQSALCKWASQLSTEDIQLEFAALTSSSGSKNEVLKLMSAPVRFEFLTSVALAAKWPNLRVRPNYPVDDEGMPTSTASGGHGDIEVSGKDVNVLVEVTLMQNKSQAVNEIPAITRHLKEYMNAGNKNAWCLFIAPRIHADSRYMAGYSKQFENVEIYPYGISRFAKEFQKATTIVDLASMPLDEHLKSELAR